MCYWGAKADCTMEPRIMKSEAQTRPSLTPNQLDLLMIMFLIGFDVAALWLRPPGNGSPVAAAARFAGMMLRRRWVALLVPLAALALSDLFIAGDDWRGEGVGSGRRGVPGAGRGGGGG